MSRKRLIPMALVVMSALAFMAPAAAQADDTFAVAACVLVPGSVDGNTTVPSVAADLADNSSWEPTGLLDTETGSFTFSGPAACGGADVAGNTGSTPDAIVGVFDIDARGTFVNLICGTGSANGTAELTGDGTAINTTFSISFFAGAGQLSIVVNETGAAGASHATGALGTDNAISGGTGAGVIDIAPNSLGGGGSCGDGPGVTGFLVNGAFYATLQG